MKDYIKNYPHIIFKKSWEITDEMMYIFGQCDSIIKSISNTPISPEYRKKLHSVALIKGAQATTAIEGNTLSFEEIEDIQNGKKLPPSREYLQIEVQNILDSLNAILKDIMINNAVIYASPELIKNFHQMVGKNLGEHFAAIPGKYRNNNVVVGQYRCPDYQAVPEMIEHLCGWLKEEFRFKRGQTFKETIMQAVITHIYIVWIHPFSDGNGRTARLIEFYLLLRAGVPDIASHVLSNFYNLTRAEYYRQIEKATKNRNLTEFILYAVQGFRDGLLEVLKLIQENQKIIAWKSFIYETLEYKGGSGKSEEANKRKLQIMINFPVDRDLSVSDILNLNSEIIRAYKDISDRSFMRDLKELIKFKLLVKERKKYKANINILSGYMAAKIS